MTPEPSSFARVLFYGGLAVLAVLAVRAVAALFGVRGRGRGPSDRGRDAKRRVLFEASADGRRISVSELEGTRELRVEPVDRESKSPSGELYIAQTKVSVAHPLRTVQPYTDAFHLAPAFAPGVHRALFLGGGGCLAPRQFRALDPQMELDVVEIDASVARAAERYFWFRPDPRMRLHVADGRAFVDGAAPGSYDLIVVDAYVGFDVPRALASRDFFLAAARALGPSGALCANMTGRLESEPCALWRSLVATAASVFGPERLAVYAVPLDDELEGALEPKRVRNFCLWVSGGAARPTDEEVRRAAEGVDPAIAPFARVLARYRVG